MTDSTIEKYKKAKEKVRAIRGFHSHVKAFIVVNIVLFIIKTRIYRVVSRNPETVDVNFENWLNWNFIFTVVVWGIILLIHGLYVHDFKFKFIKDWEERKINQIIDKENSNNLD